MRISRVEISNFRNFQHLDVLLCEYAVIVGENKIGKSNLLHALRLVLDPSLADSGRQLRDEDFWDGLPRPLARNGKIASPADSLGTGYCPARWRTLNSSFQRRPSRATHHNCRSETRVRAPSSMPNWATVSAFSGGGMPGTAGIAGATPM